MIKTYFYREETLEKFKRIEECNIGKIVIGCYRLV